MNNTTTIFYDAVSCIAKMTTTTTTTFAAALTDVATAVPSVMANYHKCIDTKDGISIATGILSMLLIISEILPYCSNEKCNGIIQALECLIKSKIITPIPSKSSIKEIETESV